MNKDEIMALGVEEGVAETIALESEKEKEGYEARISEIMRENEIDVALRNAGARNLKAVRALLDNGEDFKSQIETLKSGEDTKFLFESEKKSFTPYKSNEKLPDTDENEFEAKLSLARQAGNTVEAIRIKQMAASKGIMLI